MTYIFSTKVPKKADLLHQTTFDALSSLADFSLLVGKEELFYEFLF